MNTEQKDFTDEEKAIILKEDAKGSYGLLILIGMASCIAVAALGVWVVKPLVEYLIQLIQK